MYVHNSAWNPGLLDSYASSVGVMPAMALSFHDWAASGDGGDVFPRAMLDAFTARGITPVVTWEPWNWNGSGSDPAYKLANIQAGNFDTYINSWVTGARAYGKPIYLRFAHEMNGNWYPWGVGVNGNTPAQFVKRVAQGRDDVPDRRRHQRQVRLVAQRGRHRQAADRPVSR